MTSNEFIRREDGDLFCDMCGFTTPHESKMKRHMVKSHGHEPYPDPPVLAEKWRVAEEVRAGFKPAPTKAAAKKAGAKGGK